ncbi:MAG: hypothetical protein ABFE07_04890 [Armatimonadia bacterium]
MPPDNPQHLGLERRAPAPGCSPNPPPVDASEEFLRYLLSVEIERLETARRIEQERNFVFPETTVIIRDIMKLRAAILSGQETEAEPEAEAAAPPPEDELSALLRQVQGDQS